MSATALLMTIKFIGTDNVGKSCLLENPSEVSMRIQHLTQTRITMS